ncbi:hypothetical protein GCM10010210_08880 [Pseudonocardia hydrocarbonoxydans]|uniref:Uncharacterized protein n=1 Tax=Pseudonocardia hydrocarbonoxydans TaxID=76726 RepID=A0A4Y3WMZ0_9PSEU|nr:hypothetical protein PHY01_21410 [Pseudonocardia hydrocarbonoxydans]
MYSALALPSSIRAAPAKNRIWSTIGGISSDAVRPRGLPVLRASASTSRSAPASTASAMASSFSMRSPGVVRRHCPNARAAAANAASTSGAVDSGAVA